MVEYSGLLNPNLEPAVLSDSMPRSEQVVLGNKYCVQLDKQRWVVHCMYNSPVL